jgi:diguanylate cyclase (GGDEF)-like protein
MKLMNEPVSNSGVLIVDDNVGNLRVLSNILRGHGYGVRSLRKGETVFSSVLESPPDIILLDIMMPDMNGYEVCGQLKADERTCGIPVIFISALHEIDEKVKAFSAGGVDYITKPFQEQEVLVRVHTHLMLRRTQISLEQEISERTRAEKELKQAKDALEQANRELQRLASSDGLTRIANRRRLDEYLRQEWKRLAREQVPLSLILCDIDFFKNYNDTYGHLSGDDCLFRIARVIQGAARRPADLAARYGGEEFAIVLPNTDSGGAMQVAGCIQDAVSRLKIPHSDSSVSCFVTLSIGVSSMIPTHTGSPDLLIHAADQALYEVKKQSRNAVLIKTDVCAG